MKKYTLIVTAIITLVAIYPALITSCSINKAENNTGKTFTVWWSDPDEYNTNVLSVAQEETPFTIILPEYLPDSIATGPIFSGPAKNEFKENASLSISYRGREGKSIEILEYSKKQSLPLNDDATHFYYLATEVVEIYFNEIDFNDNGSTLFIPVYAYNWNWNDIHVDVTIYNYECDEARNIVKSMIR
jgi:hypothetical protein